MYWTVKSFCRKLLEKNQSDDLLISLRFLNQKGDQIVERVIVDRKTQKDRISRSMRFISDHGIGSAVPRAVSLLVIRIGAATINGSCYRSEAFTASC